MVYRKIASIGARLGPKLKAYFLLILSIEGFVLVAYLISIDFLPKKKAKIGQKSNSLITYIFWAKLSIARVQLEKSI